MTKFLLYNGRHGEEILTPHTAEYWEYLLNELEQDDGIIPSETQEYDLWIDGSPVYNEDAYISVDDGGQIKTIELSEQFD